jgi:uncharacterized OB-fold protein
MGEFTVTKFKEELKNENLLGSKCTKCGNLMLPPRIICNNCGNKALHPYHFKREGIVKALSTIYVPLTQFQEKCPYTVGIIKIFEGPKISGLILDDEKVKIGSKVEAVFLNEDERTILAFKPT